MQPPWVGLVALMGNQLVKPAAFLEQPESQTAVGSTVALSSLAYCVPSPVALALFAADEILGPQVPPSDAAPILSGSSTARSSAVSEVPISVPSASWLTATAPLLADGPFPNVVSSWRSTILSLP